MGSAKRKTRSNMCKMRQSKNALEHAQNAPSEKRVRTCAKCAKRKTRSNMRKMHTLCMCKVSFSFCTPITYAIVNLYQMIQLANSEGPDQTARMRSLIWAFAVHIYPDMFSHGTAKIYIKMKTDEMYLRKCSLSRAWKSAVTSAQYGRHQLSKKKKKKSKL